MYERRSRLAILQQITIRQQAELIKFFVAGATTRAAGEPAGVHRNTAASYFMKLRRLIAMPSPAIGFQEKLRLMSAILGGRRKGKLGRKPSRKPEKLCQLARR